MLARAHPGMRALPAYFLSRPHVLNVEFAACSHRHHIALKSFICFGVCRKHLSTPASSYTTEIRLD